MIKRSTSEGFRWATASSTSIPSGAGTGHTSSIARESQSLGVHLSACNGSRSPLFALECMAEAANTFFARRFVTVPLAVAVALGLAALLM